MGNTVAGPLCIGASTTIAEFLLPRVLGEFKARLQERSVTPRQLIKHPYFRREGGSGTRGVTDHYFEKAEISPDSLNTVMEAGSPEALKGLVAAGTGYAIMSRAAAAKEAQLGQLVLVPLSARLVRYLSVVYAKERFHSKAVNSFAQFAREKLAERATDLQFA